VRALAAKFDSERQPGDQVLVDPYTRYVWALSEERRVRIVFGQTWSTGFSVLSDRPEVYIAPTEPWEIGYAPGDWAVRVADAGRLWYLGTNFLARDADPVYLALVGQGWKPQEDFGATGGFLVLMTGGGTPSGELVDHGIAAQAKGHNAAAAAAFNAAIAKDPSNYVAQYNLGVVDEAAGRPDAARADYRRALVINSEYVPALVNLAGLMTNADAVEATKLYRRVLALRPGDANTEFNLGLLLIHSAQAAEGRTYLDDALRKDPSLAARVPAWAR
jgi:tetratricopeptide (TPR) repeat protein